MNALRLVGCLLAIAVGAPFILLGIIVGPMRLGFEVGLEVWNWFEDSARARVRERQLKKGVAP